MCCFTSKAIMIYIIAQLDVLGSIGHAIYNFVRLRIEMDSVPFP